MAVLGKEYKEGDMTFKGYMMAALGEADSESVRIISEVLAPIRDS